MVGPHESTIFDEEPVDAEYEPPIIADEMLLSGGLKESRCKILVAD